MASLNELDSQTKASGPVRMLLLGWLFSALGWAIIAFALSWNLSSAFSIRRVDAFLWLLPNFALMAFFTPLIFLAVTKYPFERDHWKRPLLVQGSMCLCLMIASHVFGAMQPAPLQTDTADSDFGMLIPSKLPLSPPVGPQLLVFAVIASIAHALHYYRRFGEREKAALEKDALLAQARLQALRMQIQPHFLFNALNALSSLILSDPKSADRMLSSICAFLRLTLDAQPEEMVPLIREIEFAQKYLEIEKLRFRDRLHFSIECDSALHRVPVPTLLLQPLVENAIRHGIAAELEGGGIRITVVEQAGMLVLTVTDDGKGFPLTHVEGIGLANIRRRLEGHYGRNAFLKIRSTSGTEVSISIPLSGKA